MIHYEEALYQVYRMYLYLYLPVVPMCTSVCLQAVLLYAPAICDNITYVATSRD